MSTKFVTHYYWSVKITQGNGAVAYLRNKDRTCWTRKHARRLASEWHWVQGVTATLEPAESYEFPR